jgi:hypothetical protein
MRLDIITVQYFKCLAHEIGIPYQTLIMLYLCDSAGASKKLSLHWKPAI